MANSFYSNKAGKLWEPSRATYSRLGKLRSFIDQIPVIAHTATATQEVLTTISKSLDMTVFCFPQLFSMSALIRPIYRQFHMPPMYTVISIRPIGIDRFWFKTIELLKDSNNILLKIIVGFNWLQCWKLTYRYVGELSKKYAPMSVKASIGHANEYTTMHYFGTPRHAQSMIAYIILPEYFWKF